MMAKTKGLHKATLVRQRILEAHGKERGTYGRLTEREAQKGLPQAGDRDGTKTPLMLAMELVFGEDIDRLLDPGRKLGVVSKKLGLDKSTVSRWRLLRGLRVREDGTDKDGEVPGHVSLMETTMTIPTN